jgi:hypothetical protein
MFRSSIHIILKPLILAFAIVGSSGALGGTITSSLDRTEASLGEVLVMTITIEGSGATELDVPQVDGLVIQQRGVSQSTSFINGHTRQELTINYLVQAQRPGKFTIPSMSLELDGKKESTLPLTITINNASTASASNQIPQTNRNSNKSLKNAAAQNATGIMIERDCDKTQPYVGEQVICAVRIYHRGNLAGGQKVQQNSTEYRRFATEGERQYQKVVNGQRYAVIELKEIFVPLKDGKISLGPFELDARVVAWNRRGNPLDKFFDRLGGGMFNFDMAFTEETQVTLKSEPTVLEVKALPSAGRPANFSGLVGQYQITAQKTTDRLAAMDTLTVTVNIEGIGLLDTAASPFTDNLPGSKIYADKPDYKEQIDPNAGIRSAKTFKYAVVPSQPGTMQLPAVELNVFNPRLGQYVTLQADLGTLIVDPAKAEQKPLVLGQQTPTGPNQQAVKALDQDLLGLHRDVDLARSQTITTFEKGTLAGLGLLSFLAPFSTLAFTSWRKKRHGDTDVMRRSRAFKDFRALMNSSQKARASGDPADGLNGAYTAFKTYLGHKSGRQGAALTLRDMEAILIAQGATDDQIARVREFVGACEKMAFGGMQPSHETVKILSDQVSLLVEELEKA